MWAFLGMIIVRGVCQGYSRPEFALIISGFAITFAQMLLSPYSLYSPSLQLFHSMVQVCKGMPACSELSWKGSSVAFV